MSATGFIAQDVPAVRRAVKDWNEDARGERYRRYSVETGLWLGSEQYMVQAYLRHTLPEQLPDPWVIAPDVLHSMAPVATEWWVKTSFGRMLGDQSINYYVSSEMMTLASRTSESLGAFQFAREDFPSRCGFMVFGGYDPYTTEVTRGDVSEQFDGPLYFVGVSWAPDIDSPDTMFVEWWLSAKDAIGQMVGITPQRAKVLYADRPPLLSDVESHVRLEQQIDPERKALKHIRLLYTLFRMMRERQVATDIEAPSRAERKRHARAGLRDPDVRVIRLRGRRETASPEEHRTVDWSCRWVVDAHWRNQPYGPRGGRKVYRPKLIMPYVKGPDDKPLRETPKVKVL